MAEKVTMKACAERIADFCYRNGIDTSFITKEAERRVFNDLKRYGYFDFVPSYELESSMSVATYDAAVSTMLGASAF